jgi:hypothetical protein
VLEGTIHARVGGEELKAPPGSYLVEKKGVPHAIWNMGPKRSRVAEIVSPAGFKRYFEEIEPVLRGHGPESTSSSTRLPSSTRSKFWTTGPTS